MTYSELFELRHEIANMYRRGVFIHHLQQQFQAEFGDIKSILLLVMDKNEYHALKKEHHQKQKMGIILSNQNDREIFGRNETHKSFSCMTQRFGVQIVRSEPVPKQGEYREEYK